MSATDETLRDGFLRAAARFPDREALALGGVEVSGRGTELGLVGVAVRARDFAVSPGGDSAVGEEQVHGAAVARADHVEEPRHFG